MWKLLKSIKLPGFDGLPKPIPPAEAAKWFTFGGIDIHVDKGGWIGTGANGGWKDWREKKLYN